jgi:hypothetical protein
MAIHLDFQLPNGTVSSVTLNDTSLTAIPLVGDLVSTGAPPDYKIMSRRFDFFGAEPPTGDVTILLECQTAEAKPKRKAPKR